MVICYKPVVCVGATVAGPLTRLQPGVEVEPFRNIDEIESRKQRFDLIVMDGRPHSTAGTLRMAAAADLVVLPVDLSMDDLEPSVLLAHELVR